MHRRHADVPVEAAIAVAVLAPAECWAAARYLAGRATDADELRELLAALGILGTLGETVRPAPSPKTGHTAATG